MSNDDPKTEKPGLISRLVDGFLGLLGFDGDKSQGLKESKESDIDRRIRYNDRNVRVLFWAVVALLGFGATRDISKSNISSVLNFNFYNATLNDYAQIIQVSWDIIIALSSFTLAIVIAFIAILMLFRGVCLNKNARLVETNNVTSRVNKIMAQAQKKINNAEFKAKQANTRADKAEDRLREANKRAETAEAKIKEANKRAEIAEAKIKAANDRADNALMIAVYARTVAALTRQRIDGFKDELVLARKENHLLMVDLTNAREEIKKARVDIAKRFKESQQLRSELSKFKNWIC